MGVKLMTFTSKKEYREEVLTMRSEVAIDVRNQWDEIIFNKLINSYYYKNYSTIFTFVSFKDEVDTHKFIEHALRNGKKICVPKVPSKKEGMKVYFINNFEDLKKGYFDILEPVEGCIEASPEEIDFILMPGVAFDRQGNRIGYGAGFYDRFLSQLKNQVPKIALAYDFQVYEEVPNDEFDVRIDGIITEKEFITF